MVPWDGMDSRNRVVSVGQTGTFPASPVIPMAQWDGMDSRNRVVYKGRTDWYILHSFPWSSGMGWTVGTAKVAREGRTKIFPVCSFLPMVEWDGVDRLVGWDVFPVCPAIPIVQWDGIDCTGIFPVYQSFPCVQGTVEKMALGFSKSVLSSCTIPPYGLGIPGPIGRLLAMLDNYAGGAQH